MGRNWEGFGLVMDILNHLTSLGRTASNEFTVRPLQLATAPSQIFAIPFINTVTTPAIVSIATLSSIAYYRHAVFWFGNNNTLQLLRKKSNTTTEERAEPLTLTYRQDRCRASQSVVTSQIVSRPVCCTPGRRSFWREESPSKLVPLQRFMAKALFNQYAEWMVQ